jgi:predicted enzyme related to lactoylglutathione lyase
MGIWFLKAEGKAQKERIGNQTAGQPAMVVYTNDLSAQYEKMLANDVKIKVEPVKTPEYNFFHCYDSSGNELIVTELKTPSM